MAETFSIIDTSNLELLCSAAIDLVKSETLPHMLLLTGMPDTALGDCMDHVEKPDCF
jgi:hypothetical protein